MGRQQKVSRSNQGGFTLIELLVVVVIMAMSYALASPMISSGVSGTELKASARQLAAGLRKARSDAVAQRRETVLTVDVDGHQFQVSGDSRIYRLHQWPMGTQMPSASRCTLVLFPRIATFFRKVWWATHFRIRMARNSTTLTSWFRAAAFTCSW